MKTIITHQKNILYTHALYRKIKKVHIKSYVQKIM